MMNTVRIPINVGKPRLNGHIVDTIVIHAMSEYFKDSKTATHMHATDFLKRAGLSCHYMINQGGTIIKCADPDTRTTWHAKFHNNNSVGIELLVPGYNPYELFNEKMKKCENWLSQIAHYNLKILCLELMRRFNMDKGAFNHIVFHSQIDPHRKVDPGKPFNYVKFCAEIDEIRRLSDSTDEI